MPLASLILELNPRIFMRRTIALLCLFSFTQTYAGVCTIDESKIQKACLALKIKEKIIHQKSEALESIRGLQEKLLAGKRLQERLKENASDLTDEEKLVNQLALLTEGNELEKLASERLEKRIINTEDDMELITVEEQLKDELGDVHTDNTQHYYKGAASIGGLVLFSFVLSRMARSTRGQALKRRLMAQIFPTENRFVKTGVNIGLLISLGTGFLVLHKLYQNKEEEKSLLEMIDLINQIKDQTETIITLKEEIDEMDVCFWLQYEQLRERQLASIEKGQLVCQ